MLIAQLSDIHIRPFGMLYKDVVDSNQMLLNSISHLEKLDKQPDLVVITGDLVDMGEKAEYLIAAKLLKKLKIPYIFIPGNHDVRDEIRSAFPEHKYLPGKGPLNFVIDSFPVRIIGVDSTVPCMHHGETPADTVNWLNDTLAQANDKPTLILMHHPPFASGIPYMDDYKCMDSGPLASILRRYSNIEAILCGHVHRLMVHRWAGTVVIACPSTATEIALQFDANATPQSYLGDPQYMLHLWSDESGLVSHLCNVTEQDGPFPFY